MNNFETSHRFILGNVVLGLALLLLIFLDPVSEVLGSLAMALWIGLVGLGVYLLSGGHGGGPLNPN